MSVKLLLDPTDEWADIEEGETETVTATGCEILATAEPGNPDAKMKLRLNLPDGRAVIFEDHIPLFVQAIRGMAAKYGA